jgi:hypothetical protein
MASLLFAVHPIHVEAVSNIIGRAELLSALFSLGTVLAVIYASKDRTRNGSKWFFAALVLFALATFSKESGFTLICLLPFVMVSCPRSQEKAESLKGCAIRTLPFVAIAVVSLVARRAVLGPAFLPRGPRPTQVYWENPLFHLSFVDRKVAALKVLGDYLRLLLFPMHLSADYSRMPADFLADVYSWDGVLSLLVLLAFTLSIYLQRRERHAVFGVWFFVTFLVASNLLTLAGTVMGERLAYLPSIGFIAYCALTVGRARMATTSVLLSLLVACLWARSAVRQAVWRDNETLLKQTVQDAPRSPKALYNYAVFLLDEKKEPSVAKDLFGKVLAMDSTHVLTLMCLSDIAAEEKQYEEMADWYRRILAIDPGQTKIRQELERYEKWRHGQSSTRSDS